MDQRSAWHDHRVAAAADAWLAHPDDTQAYTRLVDAIHRRRAWLAPTLPTGPADSRSPEILDEVGADRPPRPVGALLDAGDPHASVDRLRHT